MPEEKAPVKKPAPLYPFSPQEQSLIRILREYLKQEAIAHGQIPCIIYIQDGKMIRMEIEKAKASYKF